MPATRPPLNALRPAMGCAVVFAAGAAGWGIAGDALPGGRWMAVHLFTLGVVSVLVAMLSRHFAATMLHVREPPSSLRVLVPLAAGAVGVVVGRAAGWTPVLAAGATLASAGVLVGYVDIRRMRKRSLGSRFVFVVRAYERAHGQFLHGALLGALLGIGVLPGTWYGPVRLAHLHVMVLGWAGVTLLATLTFFGPTVFRTRILPGAERTSAAGLRWAATAVTVATFALVGSGVGGDAGTVLRVVAGTALGGFAVASAVVVAPVVRAARRGYSTLSALLVRDASAWFVAAVALDAVVVSLGRWRWLDAVGVAILVGALATSILGSVTYLAPMLRGVGPEARQVIRERVEAAPRLRAALVRGGTGAVVTCALLGRGLGASGAVVIRVGWIALASALALQLVLLLWPSGRGGGPLGVQPPAGAPGP